MRITIGLAAQAYEVASKDAIAVQTLRENGAVVYVKTTMPQTGMVCLLCDGHLQDRAPSSD